mgnify:CR=1 FL=1
MPSDFQKTVNLKDKAEKERQRLLYGEPEKVEKKIKSKAEEIDEVYKPTASKNTEENLRKINRPIIKQANERIYRNIIIALAVVLIIGAIYFLFFNDREKKVIEQGIQANNWYAVKLDNNEMYYGQIDDTSADPVKIKNVYYDYDQINKTGQDGGATGSLRLVKKGKETYGPSGTMEVYHIKIISLDLLKEDSKVLKAILDYENKSK